jgi:RNA polymerase subunit RPABC4/transcription elongation factor Spt4
MSEEPGLCANCNEDITEVANTAIDAGEVVDNKFECPFCQQLLELDPEVGETYLLKPCRSCSHIVREFSKSCPNCGEKWPAGEPGFMATWGMPIIVLAVLAVVLLR